MNRMVYFYLIVLLFVVVWMLESSVTKVYLTLNSYYIIFYSLVLVMLSTYTISIYSKHANPNILHRPMFIICCSFILFYCNTIIIDTFSAYTFRTSQAFRWHMLDILHFINIICNLLYSFAIFQLPKRQKVSFGIE